MEGDEVVKITLDTNKEKKEEKPNFQTKCYLGGESHFFPPRVLHTSTHSFTKVKICFESQNRALHIAYNTFLKQIPIETTDFFSSSSLTSFHSIAFKSAL